MQNNKMQKIETNSQPYGKYFLKHYIPEYIRHYILALAHSLMHTLEEEIYKQQDTNETLSIKMGMGFLPVLVIWSGSGQ